MIITLRRHSLLFKAILPLLLVPLTAVAAPPSRDAQRLKNELERQAVDRLRRVEQQRRDEQNRRDNLERQQREAQDRARREAQWAQERARWQDEFAKSQKTPTSANAFNAAAAPSPDDCLKYFILAAKSATTMDQLLAYLPESEQKALRDKQARFDSQNADQTSDDFSSLSSSFSREQSASLSTSPYEAALQSSKSFSRQVMDILDVKVTGDQAELTVATGYYINENPVKSGKAYVQMVGEGSLWRVKTNGSSPLVRKQQFTGP